jgi:polysaccharide biosynthesis protein PslL
LPAMLEKRVLYTHQYPVSKIAYSKTSRISLVIWEVTSYTRLKLCDSKQLQGWIQMQEIQAIEMCSTSIQSTMLRRRVPYVDIAKGIGILLVVMGHNDFRLISPYAHKLIYSFHMPMFFFMSGMFFKPDIPFFDFLRNRFHRVLKPFLAILLLIFFASLSFSKISLLMAGRRLIKALYGSGYYIDWVQLWFLPYLFAVSLFAYVFFKIVKGMRPEWLRWVLLLGLYTAGILSIRLFWPFELRLLGNVLTLHGLPYGLDMVTVSGFYFILGHEIHQHHTETWFENSLVFLMSGALLLFLVAYFPARIDLNTRQFDSLIINTVEALTGIHFMLALSKQLVKNAWLSSIFSYVGQASLIVLLFQVPIQDFWGQKLFAVTGDPSLSYWLSFLAGVAGPLVINALFIRPNTIVREWFGQAAPREKKKASIMQPDLR